MIAIKTDDDTRESYIRNVIAVWNSATEDQLARGRNWYTSANQLASMIADGNVVKGAGVIAALSANKRWADNTKLATRAFADGKPSGHVGAFLRKAARIMDGEDPAKVLPMDLKTGNFYECIRNPAHPRAVCVDRHAHDIALGAKYGDRPRGLSARGRYNLLADVYRVAAMRLGELPLVVQAGTWVVWTEGQPVQEEPNPYFDALVREHAEGAARWLLDAAEIEDEDHPKYRTAFNAAEVIADEVIARGHAAKRLFIDRWFRDIAQEINSRFLPEEG